MLILGLLLFLGAWVGHTAVLVFSLNSIFGRPLPRRVQKTARLVLGLFFVAGPVVLWMAFGFNLAAGLSSLPGNLWRDFFAGYVLLCWVLGLGVVPALTLYRLLRRRPAVLLSNHTRTVDVAGQIGFRPVGRGKYRLLARLPGNEVFRVDFSERTLRLPQLPPAWDGLAILHLSDLHLCGTPDRVFFQYVMDQCRSWEADLVAITGDIVDSDYHHRWIVPVLGQLRWKWGAFAVLGNHDLWHDPPLVRRRLRRLGMRVLGNAWEQVEVRGQPLVVIGHEGPWFRPEPDLSTCPAGVFRLCLSHTPDNIVWARRHQVDLMLAGHNHGGQVRFPVIGSVLVPSCYSRRYDCGTFHEGQTVLHVSRGLGGLQPLRYNCRPEVTKILLRS